ncbi:TRAP transporter small permease [Paramaledivibacter caminithermalis]|uniref:TRAP transporter small permease n=1 Tax=Paramaledivibacter caminithermalis TaxID=191027 RepID=UPI000D0957CC
MVLLKLFKILDEKLEEVFLIYSLIFTVAIIFLQVVMRYVFKNSLSWSEELARYIFLWQIWVGASYAVKKSKHLRVGIINSYISEKGKIIVEILVIILWICFSVFLTTKSAELTGLLFKRNQLSPAMRMPMGYAYASVPVGCGLMTLRLLQRAYINIKTMSAKEVEVK